MSGLKRTRSGRVKRPEGCPLTCNADLWNYLVEHKLWSVEQQLREGPGPWEIRSFQGPPEVLLGTDRYAQLQRQYQENEKRRIQLRLREIERYIRGRSWTGPEPSAEELGWANHTEIQRQIRRTKRQTKNSLPRSQPISIIKKEPNSGDTNFIDLTGGDDMMDMIPDIEWQDPYTAHSQRPLTPVAPEDF